MITFHLSMPMHHPDHLLHHQEATHQESRLHIFMKIMGTGQVVQLRLPQLPVDLVQALLLQLQLPHLLLVIHMGGVLHLHLGPPSNQISVGDRHQNLHQLRSLIMAGDHRHPPLRNLRHHFWNRIMAGVHHPRLFPIIRRDRCQNLIISFPWNHPPSAGRRHTVTSPFLVTSAYQNMQLHKR